MLQTPPKPGSHRAQFANRNDKRASRSARSREPVNCDQNLANNAAKHGATNKLLPLGFKRKRKTQRGRLPDRRLCVIQKSRPTPNETEGPTCTCAAIVDWRFGGASMPIARHRRRRSRPACRPGCCIQLKNTLVAMPAAKQKKRPERGPEKSVATALSRQLANMPARPVVDNHRGTSRLARRPASSINP